MEGSSVLETGEGAELQWGCAAGLTLAMILAIPSLQQSRVLMSAQDHHHPHVGLKPLCPGAPKCFLIPTCFHVSPWQGFPWLNTLHLKGMSALLYPSLWYSPAQSGSARTHPHSILLQSGMKDPEPPALTAASRARHTATSEVQPVHLAFQNQGFGCCSQHLDTRRH